MKQSKGRLEIKKEVIMKLHIETVLDINLNDFLSSGQSLREYIEEFGIIEKDYLVRVIEVK